MLKKLRRSDRGMSIEAVTALLDQADYGVLSTTGANGDAYGVPLSFIFVDDAIYFHGALEGHKVENILQNNKVSFCVVDGVEPLPEKFSMKYRSAIVFGKVSEVVGEEKLQALKCFVEKYASQYMNNGIKYIDTDKEKTRVLKLNIEQISGKERI